jgi:hypothetical protein
MVDHGALGPTRGARFVIDCGEPDRARVGPSDQARCRTTTARTKPPGSRSCWTTTPRTNPAEQILGGLRRPGPCSCWTTTARTNPPGPGSCWTTAPRTAAADQIRGGLRRPEPCSSWTTAPRTSPAEQNPRRTAKARTTIVLDLPRLGPTARTKLVPNHCASYRLGGPIRGGLRRPGPQHRLSPGPGAPAGRPEPKAGLPGTVGLLRSVR